MNASVELSISVKLTSACGLSVWLPLPATDNQFQNALDSILSLTGEDYFIDDYANTVPGLYNCDLMGMDVRRVNYLAARLEKLTAEQVNLFLAVIEGDCLLINPERLLDFPLNTEYYTLLPNVKSVYDLGRYYLYESNMVNMPERMKKLIGITSFGVTAHEADGGFFTSKGYLLFSGKKWKDTASKKAVPDKYHLTLAAGDGEDADPVLRNLRRKAEYLAKEGGKFVLYVQSHIKNQAVYRTNYIAHASVAQSRCQRQLE